ncbi:AAA domain-containing protein [Halorubrum laminariae]|uniref:AAA domain-containing protein n=1 Tax=Halorubrum laminariae TaxID=1433523 RepID=A0ABD6C4S6_9EURY|nr:AAA domain-containing protein [Halorubrum laminariae]
MTTHTAVESLSADERDDYYQGLQDFIELEREATRQEGWERYQTQATEKLAQNQQAIPEVMSIGKQHHPEYDNQYVYEQVVPDYVTHPKNLVDQFGIYPGSEVIIDVDRETDALPTEAIVTFVDEQTIGIGLKTDYDYHHKVNKELSQLDSSQEIPAYSIYQLLNPTTYDRETEAVNKAQRSDLIDEIITGEREIIERQANVAALVDPSLNAPQQRAVNRALGTSGISCIHGPPGTGKTRTLTALIKAAVAKGDHVLAVAHSNQAVDNLIVGTSDIDNPDEKSLHFAAKQDDFSIARIGQNSRNNVIQKYHGDIRPDDAQVVAGTMSACADLSRTFDWVVVDEATQAAQPATLISLLRGDNIVLAGDHRQLPPFASSEDAKLEEMHVSLFEHILDRYGRKFAERLLTQYRMNKDIAQFPSEQFYEGSLNHGNINKDWSILGMDPLSGIHVEGSEQTDRSSKSKYNIIEAQIVAEQAELLLNKGLSHDEIGIITSYSAQIGKIAGELHNQDIENPNRIEVDTIDSFQGSERKAIIVSFVRSNDRNNAGFLEFPDEGPRRLNVALTRAQKRLVLVGDFDTLGNVADHLDASTSCAQVYDDLRNYYSDLGYFESR